MEFHFTDPYRPGRSPVHDLSARVKFILGLALIVATSLMPMGAWPAYVLVLSLTLSVSLVANLGIRYLLVRSALASPFLLAAVTVIFTTPGPLWFHVALGPWLVPVTVPGVVRFLSIAFKSWLSVQAAILLTATTPFPELLMAMRALHVPRLLVAIFGLMWRYLALLADEALRLSRARDARSAQGSVPPAWNERRMVWQAQVTGGMVGNLFLRSLDRGERVYAAMAARGYTGELRGFPLPGVRRSEGVILVLGLAGLSALVVLAYAVT